MNHRRDGNDTPALEASKSYTKGDIFSQCIHNKRLLYYVRALDGLRHDLREIPTVSPVVSQVSQGETQHMITISSVTVRINVFLGEVRDSLERSGMHARKRHPGSQARQAIVYDANIDSASFTKASSTP